MNRTIVVTTWQGQTLVFIDRICAIQESTRVNAGDFPTTIYLVSGDMLSCREKYDEVVALLKTAMP